MAKLSIIEANLGRSDLELEVELEVLFRAVTCTTKKLVVKVVWLNLIWLVAIRTYSI